MSRIHMAQVVKSLSSEILNGQPSVHARLTHQANSERSRPDCAEMEGRDRVQFDRPNYELC